MSAERPVSLQGYDAAIAFWTQYHGDPAEADKLRVHDARPVVEEMLMCQFGQHPREAAWVGQAALETVLERMYLLPVLNEGEN